MLILLGVVIHGVKQFTAENADTKKGIEYIQSKENEEVKVIEQKIASLEAKDPASGDTERSLKDRFSGAVVMGDSISSGFSEYDVLNASSVVAKRGIQLEGLDEQISQAKKLNPQVVFLSYGMNDVIATDGDTEAFINKYAAVIESITKEMPSVRIYINSIFPVSASAAEKNRHWRKLQIIILHCRKCAMESIWDLLIIPHLCRKIIMKKTGFISRQNFIRSGQRIWRR